MQPVDALEGRFRTAAPLFEACKLRRHLRRFLLQRLRASRASMRAVPAVRPGRLSLRVLGFKAHRLFALLLNRLPLRIARILVARCLQRPLLQAPLDALRFASICLSAAPRFAASVSASAALFAARFKPCRQLFNVAAQGSLPQFQPCQGRAPASPAASPFRAIRASAPVVPRLPACRRSPSRCGSTRLPA